MKGRTLLILAVGTALLYTPSVSFADGTGPPVVVESKSYDIAKAVVELKISEANLQQLAVSSVDEVNAYRSDNLFEIRPVELPVVQPAGVVVSNIGYLWRVNDIKKKPKTG